MALSGSVLVAFGAVNGCFTPERRRKRITQNTEESDADRREGIWKIGYSAAFYVGWDSTISTSSRNHSALAEEVSRQLNANGAV